MSKKSVIILSSAAILLIAGVILLFGGSKQTSNPEDYYNYISAYTSGIISREASITVKLTQACSGNQDISEIFSFDPEIEGTANWKDDQTIEFVPEEKLDPETEYIATFGIEKLLGNESGLKPFVFRFTTIKRSMRTLILSSEPVDYSTPELHKINGIVETSDFESVEDLSKTIKAEYGSSSLKVKWIKSDASKKYNFVVDSVRRGSDTKFVKISWDGSKADIEGDGVERVEIPAESVFKVMSAKVIEQPDQYVSIRFSDPLNLTQELSGLVVLGNEQNLSFDISNNEIKIFPSQKIYGNYKLKIYPGIRNSSDKVSDESWEIDLLFEDIKPAVRLVNKGVILPNTDKGFVLPFEAVNLSAVDVIITKIFGNNVSQFLQVNNLEENMELTRVGKVLLRKTVQLDNSGAFSLHNWNRFSIDLNDIIRNDPEAIYNVKIGFRKSYSLYSCTKTENSEDENQENNSVSDDNPNDPSFWDFYQNYYSDYYDWEHLEDPCYKTYFGDRRSVSKNIFASDIGIIAKRGRDGNTRFITTNILTAKPMSGVKITVLDYQKQLLAELETDSDGFAETKIDDKPFVAIADYEGQKGYLKMDDGSSLSLSRFDISGSEVEKGVKGFIYGERGVWRPGDSVFVTFVLEDLSSNIPAKHPVIFELSNPRQQLAKRIVAERNPSDFYVFKFDTRTDDPTGDWNAKISVGGLSFYKSLKIETVKPNRLKIKFDLQNDYLSKWSSSKLDMKINWLHGAAGKNLKAKVDVALSPGKTVFKKYSDFIFDSPIKVFYSEPITVFDGQVNSEGETSFNVDLDIRNEAPGMLNANFMTKAFEPGGDFSTDRFSVPYHPYKYYTGIKLPKGDKARGMLLTDIDHKVKIVSVDENGKPAASRNIEMTFYKAAWKWWWDQSDDYTSNYSSGDYRQMLNSGTIKTSSKGEAEWKIQVKYPDWGRYLVIARDVESGHETGRYVYIDWPGWAGRPSDQPGGAAMLTFSSDKQKYNAGEDIKLSIPGSENGRALISIESGTKILDAFWKEMKKGENKISIKATPEMAPNVYVHVTMLQPHSNTLNDLPIRLYGIIPVFVENPATHITPVINMPSVLKPEEKTVIKVKEKSGKPMTYTIAIVDDGLLDLTRFKTPDPWSNFYKREALGVKTWDIFDMVIGAYGGKLEYLLGLGGDGEIVQPKDGSKVNRFKPMVRFMGPFTTSGSEKTHIINLPRYVGSVRTMVIAGNKGAYGFAEKTTPVRKPLMLLGTLPRLLGPNEEVELPVSVFAMEKNIKDVKISVETNDMLQVIGSRSQNIQFSSPDEKLVNFRLKVNPNTGIGKVKITAQSGNEKAQYDIDLEVRNPNPVITKVSDSFLEKGMDWETEIEAFGIEGSNKCILEVSSIPPINLGDRLNYLIQYPHGCIEQTTSGVFPQLYLDKLVELTDQQKTRAEQNIKAGIQKIVNFQNSGGGLSYWPGDQTSDEWGTCYAGHFLLEAQRKGFSVPSGFITKWKKFQKDAARKWENDASRSDLIQSYRLYTLALANDPDLASMNRLSNMANLSKTAKFRLSAAYKIAGKDEAANKIIAGLDYAVSDYKELGYTYGSDERDLAMILETLTYLGKRSEGFKIVKKLSEDLSSRYWMSTQSTAFALLAIGKYFYADKKTDYAAKYSYQISGGIRKNIISSSPLSQQGINIKVSETKKINIKNTSDKPIYARLILQGKPAEGDSVDSSSDLKIGITYKLPNGNIISPDKLEQGTDFIAEVTLQNPGTKSYKYEQMELTQIFASGWEIINTRVGGDGSFVENSQFDYQDIRDDRVYTYFSLNSGETKIFRVMLNSSYLGKYYLPAVYSQAMYDVSINARKRGGWVEVVKSGK